MTELETLQKAINDLFYQTFKEYEGGKGYSKPLIPVISERYLENRVVVMGQETYTWFRDTDDDLKNRYLNEDGRAETLNNYTDFVTERALKKGGKFYYYIYLHDNMDHGRLEDLVLLDAKNIPNSFKEKQIPITAINRSDNYKMFGHGGLINISRR
jgi:hypothetical protein